MYRIWKKLVQIALLYISIYSDIFITVIKDHKKGSIKLGLTSATIIVLGIMLHYITKTPADEVVDKYANEYIYNIDKYYLKNTCIKKLKISYCHEISKNMDSIRYFTKGYILVKAAASSTIHRGDKLDIREDEEICLNVPFAIIFDKGLTGKIEIVSQSSKQCLYHDSDEEQICNEQRDDFIENNLKIF